MNGSMALGYAIAGRSLGGLRFRGARFDRRQLKEMMTQGRSLQIVGLVGATNAQADRFMLLPFTSLTWIGAYALGSRVVYAIRAFPLAAFGPLMVRAADVDASGGRAAVKALYLRTLTVIMRYAVTLLIVMYAATYAATLAWLGARFTISAGVAVILGVGFALNIATGPGTAIAIACGRAELDRDYNLVGLGLNLILSVILGLTFGAWGVVVATTLGLALSSAWLLRAVDRWLQSDVLRVVLVSKESFALFVGATIISFSGLDVARMAAPASRAANLLIAACTALSGFVLLATVKRDYVKQAIGLRLRRFTRAGSGAQ
jgi:O-antigen/teichoic acid export membrane protein